MYLAFTRVPGEGCRRQLRSLLLYLCYVFRALLSSLVCSMMELPVRDLSIDWLVGSLVSRSEWMEWLIEIIFD